MEAEPPAQIEGGEFVCSTCGLTEHYTYKGKQPPFCKKISFIDDSYVMKDPFSPPNKNQFLLLGCLAFLETLPLVFSSDCTTFPRNCFFGFFELLTKWEVSNEDRFPGIMFSFRVLLCKVNLNMVFIQKSAISSKCLVSRILFHKADKHVD
ncbi:unnamed protein product, partial [Timema podura]|nr:unnamed protein product [Timema podura]